MSDQQIKENLAAITNPAPPKRSILSPPQGVGPLTQAFNDLYESGFREIRVTYSGYGDSGSVDTAFASDGTASAPWQRVNEARSSAITDWVESFLPGGWEINEGSDGEAIISLRRIDLHGNVQGSLSIEHGSHSIHTEYETYGGESECTQ